MAQSGVKSGWCGSASMAKATRKIISQAPASTSALWHQSQRAGNAPVPICASFSAWAAPTTPTSLSCSLHSLRTFASAASNQACGKNVTICGGGNSAHVLAALLGTNAGVKSLSILDVVKDECSKLQSVLKANDNKITAMYADGRADVVGTVTTVADDPASVIPDSDIIFLCIPSHIHEVYFKLLAPHVRPGTTLGVIVAMGGVEWSFQDAFGERAKDVTFFAMDTLVWTCRLKEFGASVEVLSTKQALRAAVLPNGMQDDTIATLQPLMAIPDMQTQKPIPQILPEPNMITCTFMNINMIWHPCISFGCFKDWQPGQVLPEAPLFYQGVDDFTASVLDSMSNEVLSVKAALLKYYPKLDLSQVMHVSEWLEKAYGNEDITDMSTLKSKIVTNRAYKGLRHAVREVPGGVEPNFSTRYFGEDIPCGLAVMKGLAEVLQVDTPTIDEVLKWCQEKMGKEYLVDGKLTGKDIGETRTPQRYSRTTPEQLVCMW